MTEGTCFASFSAMTAPSKSRTVLVVEDNEDDAFFIQTAGKKACPELTFVVAPDGPEAFAYLAQGNQPSKPGTWALPGLIIIDVRLPTANAFRLIELIRNNPALRGVKVLMWSGGAEPHLEQRAKTAGADVFLCKPGRFDQWLAALKQIAELAQSAA